MRRMQHLGLYVRVLSHSGPGTRMTVGGQPMELDARNRFSAPIALPERADDRILHGENRSDTRTRSPGTA